MSGIAIKITSLLIRTVSKPIANRIKAQAREHEGFRRICVGWAQYLHRVDIRLRLGLLNDPAKLERQAAREAEAAAKKKREAEIPTVKTEAQTKADEKEAALTPEQRREEAKPKIKPLSEAKAIDMGANFIAESFLFAVAVGTLFFDQYRSRKKEASRRNDVADKLTELEERDGEKDKRIEMMERQIRELKGDASWQWPWKKGHEPPATEGTRREHWEERKKTEATSAAKQEEASSSSSSSSSSGPASTVVAATTGTKPADGSRPALAASAPEVLAAEEDKKTKNISTR